MKLAFKKDGYIFKKNNNRKKPGLLGQINHRGLKLDGAIGQGEICNYLKSENFPKVRYWK